MYNYRVDNCRQGYFPNVGLLVCLCEDLKEYHRFQADAVFSDSGSKKGNCNAAVG